MEKASKTGGHVVREARDEDHRQLAQVLVDAFDGDPLSRWLRPDAQERRDRLGARFTEMLARPSGDAIIETTDECAGVAIWRRPLAILDWEAPPGTRLEAARFYAGVGAAAPPSPFWYLAYLAARVGGVGTGSALLRHGLARVDGACALWTSNPENLGFYERFGFAVAARHDAPGITAWWMTRGPRACDHDLAHVDFAASRPL